MFDYSNRPHGTSRREYWAQQTGQSKENYKKLSKRERWSAITGQSKENYVNNNNNSTQQTSDTFNQQQPQQQQTTYKDFFNPSGVNKVYDNAKKTYLSELKALTPRYEALYKQLESEKQLSQQQNQNLSGEELAQQKRNIAKRGIAVDNSNQFYTTQENKLKEKENQRAQATDLSYAGKRLDISGAESADKRDFSTTIANLDINRQNTIENMLRSAKSESASMNQNSIKNEMWNKTFNYNKSKDEANRALRIYEESRKINKGSSNRYNTALSSLVADAYSKPNPAPYTREVISKELESAFPRESSKIKSDIKKFFPDGWESGTLKNNSNGNDEATRQLLSDIDKGASITQLLQAYPDISPKIIKKYYSEN